MDKLAEFFRGLGRWLNTGSRETINKAVFRLAADYRHRIKSGLGASGERLAGLKESTLNSPIRRDSNSAKRSSFGNTPLSASGATADSIRAKKVGFDTWEISSNTAQGDAILRSNAKTTHGGSPFAGDTPKAVRDPLQVTDKQLDLVVDQILQDLEKVLGV